MGLGSNIGNSKEHIQNAIKLIKNTKSINFIKSASFYQSKAWGKTDQNDFINTAIEIKTDLSPEKLLIKMLAIEKQLGRQRIEKWGPRIIDIDLLLYGKHVVNLPQLTIPHPYISKRNFVLLPLIELNNRIFIPNKGKITQLMPKELLVQGIIKLK